MIEVFTADQLRAHTMSGSPLSIIKELLAIIDPISPDDVPHPDQILDIIRKRDPDFEWKSTLAEPIHDLFDLIHKVNVTFFIPRGILFNVNFVGARSVAVISQINTDSVTETEYLGRKILTADMHTYRTEDCTFGICLGNLTLVDHQNARIDALNMYQIYSFPSFKDPKTFRLVNRIQRESMQMITADQYSENFGVVRLDTHELEHAKNNIWTMLLFGSNDSTCSFQELVADAILKEDSYLRSYLKTAEEVNPSARSFVASGIEEYAAQLGGIRQEIHTHIKNGDKELAVAAFADFHLTSYLRLESLGEDARQSYYGLAMTTYFSGLSELGFQGDNHILNFIFDGDLDTRVKRVTELVDSLYALDFRTEEERKAILADKP